MGDDLSTGELADLLATLEGGLASTASGFRTGTMLVGALFGVMGVFYASKSSWAVAAIILAFAGGMIALGVLAAKRTSPERMQPVFAAVRDAPGDVTWVRHYTTSDSIGLFVRHWLEIKTSSSRFVMQAPQWERLLGLLRRRCPGATFVD